MFLLGVLFYFAAVRGSSDGQYQVYDYKGKYSGQCYEDGLYYMDSLSFVLCAGKNAYQQPCAPGTRNPPYSNYEAGGAYGSTDFCTINLNDFGYVPGYDRHETYGGYHVDTSNTKPYYGNYNKYTDEHYGVRDNHYNDHSLLDETYHGYDDKHSSYDTYGDSYKKENTDRYYGDKVYGEATNYHDDEKHYYEDSTQYHGDNGYGRRSRYHDDNHKGVSYERKYTHGESYSRKQDGYGEEKSKLRRYRKGSLKKVVHNTH